MNRYIGIKTFLVLSVSLLFFGCAGGIGNSLGNFGKSSNFQGETQSMDYKTLAKKYHDENKTGDLLWDYEAGTVNSYIKDYKFSNHYFDIAENLIKKYDEEVLGSKVAANVGSLLSNDTFMDYRPKIYEKIMLNTLKGINFINLNDQQNARVEFNRALVRQQRAKVFFEKEIAKTKEDIKKEQKEKLKKEGKKINDSVYDKAANSKEANDEIEKKYSNLFAFKPYPDFVNPFTTYMAALYFYNVKDYRKASDLFKETYGMIKGLDDGAKYVKKDWILALKAKRSGAFRKKHFVWVIFLNGEGPFKDELKIDIPLFLLTDDLDYTGIALPTLKFRDKAYKSLKISNLKKSVETKKVASMDRVVKTEFKKRFPSVVTRAIFRTVTQTVLQKQIKDKTKSMGTFGLIARIAGSVYQFSMNRADTRIWNTLPKEFQTARIKTGKSAVIYAGEKKIADIKTNPRKNYMIFVRIPTKKSEPVISYVSF